MFNFSGVVAVQGQSECATDKSVSDRKEMTENINDRNETEFASVEDTLNMHRTALNETTLVSQIPKLVIEENAIIASRQAKTVSSLNDEFCEQKEFPKGKFGYKAPRDIPISPAPYFNQRLLNFNQYFASLNLFILCTDADYLFFARFVYE